MRIAAILASTIAIGLASGQSVAPTRLITSGPITVTSDDFEAYLLRVPEASRVEARSSYEWIGKAIDSVFENRVLAAEARRLGYDKDPKIALRMKQVEEAYLAQIWTDRFRREFTPPDLAQRAREIYLVSREKFTEPERVSGTYLAVLLQGRSREAARAFAEDLRKQALAGANFQDLAASFSEDPGYAKNKGRIEKVTRSALEEPAATAIFALKRPGEITPPIETRQGFLLVQLERKDPARVKPFEEVEAAIVAQETDRLLGLTIETEVARLKDPSRTVVNTKNIEALRVELDKSIIDRAHQEAIKALSPTSPPVR